VSTEVEAGKSW